MEKTKRRQIAPQSTAETADDLFEAAGFGAVYTDLPIKGFLAVGGRSDTDGQLVKILNHEPT
jgi:hypothetical protein